MTNRPPAVEVAMNLLINNTTLPTQTVHTLTDYIDKLEQAAPVWQPIETAPKDGTMVVLWRDIPMKMGELFASWSSYVGYWEQDGEDGDSYWVMVDIGSIGDAMNEPCNIPTHWMPLPTPPSSDTGKVE